MKLWNFAISKGPCPFGPVDAGAKNGNCLIKGRSVTEMRERCIHFVAANYVIMPPDAHRPNGLLRSLQRYNAQHNHGDSCRQVLPSQAFAVSFPRKR